MTGQAGSSTPTGTLAFQIDGSPFGNPVPLTNGSAAISTAGLPAGAHTITAFYSGDGNFLPSRGTLTGGETIQPAPLTISADTKTKMYGTNNPAFTVSYAGFVNFIV